MGLRSGFDPCGSLDVMVDQNIGGAYKQVRTVAMHINKVIKIANGFDDGSLIPNIGEKGDKGDKGDTGAKGERGDTGDRGPRGFIGDDGSSTYDLWIGEGNVGSLAQFLESLKGKDGAAAAKGEPGPKGDTGAMGPQGVPGTAAAKGDPGEAGPAGPKGDQGPAGSTGSAGPKGDAGPAGKDGKDGAMGAQGLTGSPGATGSKGADGVGISGMVITNGRLIVTLSNGNQIDAGLIGTGNAEATTANTDETSTLDVQAVLGAVALFAEMDAIFADQQSKLTSNNNRLTALGF